MCSIGNLRGEFVWEGNGWAGTGERPQDEGWFSLRRETWTWLNTDGEDPVEN